MFRQPLLLFFAAVRLRWALNKWRLAPFELAHTFFTQAAFMPANAALFITAGFLLVWLMIATTLLSLRLVRIHPPLEPSLMHAVIHQQQAFASSRYAQSAGRPTIRS